MEGESARRRSRKLGFAVNEEEKRGKGSLSPIPSPRGPLSDKALSSQSASEKSASSGGEDYESPTSGHEDEESGSSNLCVLSTEETKGVREGARACVLVAGRGRGGADGRRETRHWLQVVPDP